MGKHKHKKHDNKEKKKKKNKKEKKHKKKYCSSSSSSSSDSDVWVEKEVSKEPEKVGGCVSMNSPDHGQSSKTESEHVTHKRDEWMNISTKLSSVSSLDRRQERELQKQLDRQQDIYNPRTSVRELNPYWKDGGDGLPKFKKPTDRNDEGPLESYKSHYPSTGKGWKKKTDVNTKDNQYQSKNEVSTRVVEQNERENASQSEEIKNTPLPTDLNVLASRVIKAELLGNVELANQLREKLEIARKLKESKSETNEEEVLLTHTDSKGYTRPIRGPVEESLPSGSKSKKRKIETHSDGQRIRYFADDDKYSLQQMFENEKSVSIEDQNRDFIKIAGKVRKNDDLDEIFEDKIRHKIDTEAGLSEKAIGEHNRMSKMLDNCTKCIQSDNMLKHLMISMGETVHLSLPHHEPLVQGHCLISSIRHAPCARQLDENEWQEVLDFRKALTKMFATLNQTPIFFETAMHFNKLPHMSIECVPVPQEQGDLAPIYFKKAIDESEYEWSHNKKLVSLKGRSIQNTIPKGLPYFFVSFGMEEGFAHVIEEERYFPWNFAQEIVGGMLDLDHSKWRKPKRQMFSDQSQRVLEFSKLWSNYDITGNKN